MPVGMPEALPFVLKKAHELEWAQGRLSVLDLGIGYGFWGAALMNYCGTNPSTGRVRDGGQHLRLVGVEVWEKYKSPLWDCYDAVVVGRIEDNLPLIEKVDLVVAIDVMEHLPLEMVDQVLGRAKHFVVGVPETQEQGAVYGNEDERHRSMWTVETMARYTSEVTRLEGINPQTNPGVNYIVGVK